MKLRAILALSGLLVSSALVACGPPPNKNTAKKIGKDAGGGDRAPSVLSDVEFTESPPGGDPKVVGCADGQREGFADIGKFPSIAGCLAVWDGPMSLRKGKLGKPCGDDLDVCNSPADACAEGWHICARDGDPHDLSDRIDDQQCASGAGPGKFVAAISHVKKKKECAPAPGPSTRYPCLKEGWGAEPVCCGAGCQYGTCRDSVWAKQTKISLGTAQGCGSVTSDRNGGILCCKDSDAAPAMTPPPIGDTEAEAAAPEGEAAAPEGEAAAPEAKAAAPEAEAAHDHDH
jgi:hypothetical protein